MSLQHKSTGGTFTENRKGKLSIFWPRLYCTACYCTECYCTACYCTECYCTACYLSKEETSKITLAVPLKRPKKEAEAQRSYPRPLRIMTERESVLAAALGPLACPGRTAWSRKCLNITNNKIYTKLSLSCS